MTVKQFHKKIEVARKHGRATLNETTTLYYHGRDWSIEHKNGNTIDVSYDPRSFEYLCS